MTRTSTLEVSTNDADMAKDKSPVSIEKSVALLCSARK